MPFKIINLQSGDEIGQTETNSDLLESGQAYLEIGKQEYDAQRKIIRAVTKDPSELQKIIRNFPELAGLIEKGRKRLASLEKRITELEARMP